jgi:hypothetical protein
VPYPPDYDGRRTEAGRSSPFWLALYGLAVGLVAFASGRLASGVARDSGTTTRTVLLIVVPVGVILLAAFLPDVVMRRRQAVRDRDGRRPS